MTYEELDRQAQSLGQIEKLTPEWIEWKEPGQTVIGKILSRADVQSLKYEQTMVVYSMDTDKGPVRFKLGAASEKDIGPFLKNGEVYRIVHLGLEKIEGGKERRNFEVYHIPAIDTDSAGKEDIF